MPTKKIILDKASLKLEIRLTAKTTILKNKPLIKKTRIPVDLILKLLTEPRAEAEILKVYPQLTRESIKTCAN